MGDFLIMFLMGGSAIAAGAVVAGTRGWIIAFVACICVLSVVHVISSRRHHRRIRRWAMGERFGEVRIRTPTAFIDGAPLPFWEAYAWYDVTGVDADGRGRRFLVTFTGIFFVFWVTGFYAEDMTDVEMHRSPFQAS